jgi:drug/metabolite transporter (DMT)-like permease
LTTESARASFLTQTSVVMTPVLSALAGQRVHWPVWVACGLAMAGLILISDDEGVLLSFGPGDFLLLAGAFCWSCYLFRLSSVGDSFDEVRLQGVKTFILAILYSIWYIGASIQSEVLLWPGWTNAYAWLLLFYSAVGPGAFADIIQQMGQATVSASEANVILSLEPVFTAILALFLLGEATTLLEGFGGCMIIAASLVSSYQVSVTPPCEDPLLKTIDGEIAQRHT